MIEAMKRIKAAMDDKWITVGAGKEGGGGHKVLLDDQGNVKGGSIPKSAQGKPIGEAFSGESGSKGKQPKTEPSLKKYANRMNKLSEERSKALAGRERAKEDPLTDKTTQKQHLEQKAKERAENPNPPPVAKPESKFAGLKHLQKNNSMEEIMKRVEAEKSSEPKPYKQTFGTQPAKFRFQKASEEASQKAHEASNALLKRNNPAKTSKEEGAMAHSKAADLHEAAAKAAEKAGNFRVADYHKQQEIYHDNVSREPGKERPTKEAFKQGTGLASQAVVASLKANQSNDPQQHEAAIKANEAAVKHWESIKDDPQHADQEIPWRISEHQNDIAKHQQALKKLQGNESEKPPKSTPKERLAALGEQLDKAKDKAREHWQDPEAQVEAKTAKEKFDRLRRKLARKEKAAEGGPAKLPTQTAQPTTEKPHWAKKQKEPPAFGIGKGFGNRYGDGSKKR